MTTTPAQSSNKRARKDCDGCDECEYKYDCDQIRTKINAFLRSGEMKVSEFQRFLVINSSSYGRFMKLKGPYSGIDNQTMPAAHRFFVAREAAQIKAPKRKKLSAEDLAAYDVSNIELEGEADEMVAIYDTCDDIRFKIIEHLCNVNITQAAFLREIAKTFNGKKRIQSKQLSDFLKQRGPKTGNEGCVFYAAYVYFEKLRIKNGEEKSEKREEMEDIYGFRGLSREREPRCFVVALESEIGIDMFGRVFSYRP